MSSVDNPQSNAPGTIPRLQLSNPPAESVVDEEFKTTLLAIYNYTKYRLTRNEVNTSFLSPLALPDETRTLLRAVITVATDEIGMHWLMGLQRKDVASCIKLLDMLVKLAQARQPQTHGEALDVLVKLCSCNMSLLPIDLISDTEVTDIGGSPKGVGASAEVWCGKYSHRNGHSEDRLVALKVFRVYGSTQEVHKRVTMDFVREVLYWKNLSHPNIVPLLGVFIHQKFPLCIVSPWIDNGSIIGFLRQWPDQDRLRLLLDIASGVQYLHSIQIVHGDLKGVNILIDHTGRACLVDFGSVTPATSQTSSSGGYFPSSTLRWMAPELIDPEPYRLGSCRPTKQSDIYALGMVMLEVFTGRFPFHGVGLDAVVIMRVLRGERPARPIDAAHLGLSDSIWALMELCWHPQYQERPDITTVISVITAEQEAHHRR